MMKYPGLVLTLGLLMSVSGCASSRTAGVSGSGETSAEQLDAAQKIMGAMGGGELTDEQLKRTVNDVRTNPESRSAVEKILGTHGGSTPVIKYSPATGKHYSGELEYDPETGVKLEILPE